MHNYILKLLAYRISVHLNALVARQDGEIQTWKLEAALIRHRGALPTFSGIQIDIHVP
jgi:hypothetical protein